MTRSVPEPRYFPTLKSGEQPDLSPGVVERVTLVLTGVDPGILDDGPTKQMLRMQSKSGLSLQDLRRHADIKKISPSKTLSSDHRLVLWPCFQLTEQAFSETWQNSKMVPGAQESTLLIKKIHRLRKMSVGYDDAQLGPMTDEYREIAQEGPKILFFLFRTALRRVDRDCGEPAATPKQANFLTGLIQKITQSTPPEPPLVHFPDAVLRETEAYVETALKLNRLLSFVAAQQKRERA